MTFAFLSLRASVDRLGNSRTPIRFAVSHLPLPSLRTDAIAQSRNGLLTTEAKLRWMAPEAQSCLRARRVVSAQ